MLRRRQLAAAMLVMTGSGCGPLVDVAAGDGSRTDSSGSHGDAHDDASPGSSPPPAESGADSTSDDRGDEPPKWDMPGHDMPSRPPPEGECFTFDPARVYLLGTLSEGAAYLDAIAEPSDPYTFCVGFGMDVQAPRVRPTDARVVFVAQELDRLLEFTPDVPSGDPNGNPYPADPYGNDEVLLQASCDRFSGLAYLRLSPVDGRAWSSCSGAWFDPEGVPIDIPPDSNVVAVTPDDRLVVQQIDGLHLVAPGDPGVALDVPRPIGVLAGRAHEAGVWLVAVDYPQVFRWHLADDLVIEEGEYAPTNTGNANLDIYGGVIDGNGDFFHFGQGVGDTFNDVILRRPLLPDVTEIVYSETGLPDGTAVKIHISALFTGP